MLMAAQLRGRGNWFNNASSDGLFHDPSDGSGGGGGNKRFMRNGEQNADLQSTPFMAVTFPDLKEEKEKRERKKMSASKKSDGNNQGEKPGRKFTRKKEGKRKGSKVRLDSKLVESMGEVGEV